MKITDLEIDRFGIWKDVALPLGEPGLHVFYGPNEAGKSTLQRFVRTMLFGRDRAWPVDGEGDRSFPAGCIRMGPVSGSLQLVHHQDRYRLQRRIDARGGEQLELNGPQGNGAESRSRPKRPSTPTSTSKLPAVRLQEILANTSVEVFDRLFAIDLFELQELARLDHRELAGHLYGLSLGSAGGRLLRSLDQLRRHQEQLLSADGMRGRLPRLLAAEETLSEQMRRLPNNPVRRRELLEETEAIDAEVAGKKQRRSDIEHNLRARRHLARLHPTWEQIRECRAELSRYGATPDLPADGLAQLAEIDREAGSLRQRRDEAQTRAREAGRRAEALGEEPAIIQAEPAVQAMLGMRRWVESLETTLSSRGDSQSRSRSHPRTAPLSAISETLPTRALSGEWTEERLTQVDSSPQAGLMLADAARQYRLAMGSRSVLRKRYRKKRKRLQRREEYVSERLEDLGTSPERAAAHLRQELATAESLADLRTRESVYVELSNKSRRRRDRSSELFTIPLWVKAVLALFALAGVVFAILGIVTGVTHSAIAGVAYLLLGLTSGGIAAKLRSHFEGAIEEATDDLAEDGTATDRQLREVREKLALRHPDALRGGGPSQSDPRKTTIGETVRQAVKEFGDLDDLVTSQARNQAERKTLTGLRARMRAVQNDVESARVQWCGTLRRLGLPESLEIDESLELWEEIARHAASFRLATHEETGNHFEEALSHFGGELETLGRRLGIWHGPAGKPRAILDDWQRRLQEAQAVSEQRRQHRREQTRQQELVDECERHLSELTRQQTALLAAAGVRSRADYERRLATLAERDEWRTLLQNAETELETRVTAEPEIAFVEEDLDKFEREDNTVRMKGLAGESAELEREMETALQRRGEIARQLEELVDDDRLTRMARRKARLGSILRRQSSRLLAAGLANEAAEAARREYEQHHQPAVLASASELLQQLTGGRYRRIISPLGERTLRVEDERGGRLTIDQLSGGTREQLLLALRLGMVARAAEAGVELPLLLDDVFVNFDQMRTEAAFATLQRFAAAGGQILLFTCHLHLAELAEKEGIAPIWLPWHEGNAARRKAG